MADLNTLRTHRNICGRFVLSMFVVSWLGVSFQPCLMAMESGAEMDMESGHSTHVTGAGEMASAGAGCGHCPPAACEAIGSCVIEISPICQPDVQCSQDNRRTKPALRDAPSDLPAGIVPASVTAALACHDIVPRGINVFACVPGYRPPLNLLNCVFLI